MSYRLRSFAVAALAAAAVSAIGALPGSSSVLAGTIRHDRDDGLYADLASESGYAASGAVTWTTGSGTFLGSGTLIGSRWVLTAAHVGVDNPNTTAINFNIGGTTATNGTLYTASHWTTHPDWSGVLNQGWDVALVRLSTQVDDITPASRYTGEDVLGEVATFVGFGQTGDGLTGAAQPSGTKRAGTNMIDVYGGIAGADLDAYASRLMFSDFDHPTDPDSNRWGSAAPTDLEYMLAPGDSGGGTFIQTGSEVRLAGVISFALNSPGTMIGTYGDALASVRIAQFNQWIDDTVAGYWNSSASGSFSNGDNWSNALPFNGAPGSGDIAGLRESGSYTITFDGNASNERLLARGGNVTMNLAGNTYTLTSPAYEGALVVGKYAGETAAVNFTGGTVNTTSAIIGELPGASGTVRIANATWWNGSGGQVYVGGGTLASGGTGTIEINSGADVDISQLKVWNNGTVQYNGGEFIARDLELVGGGRVLLSPGGGKSLQNITLSIDSASGSRIDLADNEMQVFGTSLAEVHDLVKTGYAGGSWTGNGITSSSAAAEAGRALGVGPFIDGSTMVRFTWAGDSTLDGSVTIADLGVLAANWQQSNRLWHEGDFTFDGQVTIADLGVLAANWQKGPAASTTSFDEAMAMFDVFDGVIVPEPSAGITLLGAAALAALRRRRRREIVSPVCR